MARSRRVALGVGVAVVLPLLVACNAIIGLSDFDKGQCAGARCADAGSLPDVIVDGGQDSSDAFTPDARGADPVSWARWRMPNYDGDGGPGQPPVIAPPLVHGDGFVNDTTTGLSWGASVVGDFSAPQVADACKGLANGPWRAPKRIELVTLLDYSKGEAPYVDSTKFDDLVNYAVWTTSEVRPFTGGASQAYWIVDFQTGKVEPRAGNLKAKVLCVRAK